MKLGFAKKVIIKSQRQYMYGSNFYGSDVNWHDSKVYYATYFNVELRMSLFWGSPVLIVIFNFASKSYGTNHA